MEIPPLPRLTKSEERTLIIGLILLGWVLIIVFRLFLFQVVSHAEFERLAKRQQERTMAIAAPRGSVYDRNGNVLAISSPSQMAVVNPRRIPNKEIAAALLARVLHLNTQKLQDFLEKSSASKRHSGYSIVDTAVTSEEAAVLKSMNLDWLEIHEGSVRNYPNGSAAAHVIGNVDGLGNGVAGIELKLNKVLGGTPGVRRVERDGKAVSYNSEIVKAPVMGKNVGLTIDRELQYIAQESLKAAVIQNHAEHGSLVALNPRTGEILALENYPTYDPNDHLLTGEKPVGREDLAAVAPFEPGSVFKIVTLSAALETTTLTPNSLINCGGGVMRLYSRVIHDADPHGVLSMQDVLALSSNIGAIRIGQQIGNKNLYEYIRRFGFGRRTGVELPAEAPGMLRPLKRWQPTSIGSVPMGHEVSVTSVQLAQMGSIIANGGFLVHPYLVSWEQEFNGSRELVHHPDPVRVIKAQTASTMRMMMRRVMTEPHGTGRHLHVIGYTVGGKTGTAQIYDYAHRIYTHRYNASFMGFAPLNNPAVLVVVTVSGTTGQAGFGGEAAGPPFVRLMSSALNRMGIARDVPEQVEELIAKQQKAEGNADVVDDADTVAGIDTPLTPQEVAEARGRDNDIDPNATRIPDFVGKTTRDVLQEATAAGIEVDMVGDGLARTQIPLPGAQLVPGEHVRVRFSR
jgi:cell division protein FtsI (penicillin-binding protein 3)